MKAATNAFFIVALLTGTSPGWAGGRAANEVSPSLATLPDRPAAASEPATGTNGSPPAATAAQPTATAAPPAVVADAKVRDGKRSRRRFAVARVRARVAATVPAATAAEAPVIGTASPVPPTAAVAAPVPAPATPTAESTAPRVPATAAAQTSVIEKASPGPASRADAAPAPREGPAPTIADLVAKHARENGIPVELARAVVRIESRGNARASNRGAIGLMQIKPGTARSVGFSGGAGGLFSPDVNLRYGMKVLAAAYKAAGGDTCRALAQYQSGSRVSHLSAANRAYCSRARAAMAGA